MAGGNRRWKFASMTVGLTVPDIIPPAVGQEPSLKANPAGSAPGGVSCAGPDAFVKPESFGALLNGQLGSVRPGLLWCRKHGTALPAKRNDGEVFWRRLRYSTLHQTIVHPADGGADASGKTAATVCH